MSSSDASSCLQERLAALDVAGDSDEDASLTAFQSYLRGTVGRTRSAGDLRPKPKSCKWTPPAVDAVWTLKRFICVAMCFQSSVL